MIDQNFEILLKSKRLLTVKDDYILIEMSFINAPINLYDILFEIQIAGYKPILAHVERYPFYFEEYEKQGQLFDWKILGDEMDNTLCNSFPSVCVSTLLHWWESEILQ